MDDDTVESDITADIDGDGKVSPWEANLCRLCLMGMLGLAFGKELGQLL